jgi:hypothetical protein
MHAFGPVTRLPLTTIVVDGHPHRVALHIAHDGIEYVGRLWFADERWEHSGIPDRGVFPGRTADEVIALARRLREDELVQRQRRANAEKRRYHGLRRVITELLAKVRYMNSVAISMRSGMLDADAAAHELVMAEEEMVELVRQARHVAGVEG